MSLYSNSGSVVSSSAYGEESLSTGFRQATHAELHQQIALRDKTIETLTDQVKTLKEEVATLKMTLTNKKGFKKALSAKVLGGNIDLAHEEEVSKDLTRLGKYFVVFYSILTVAGDFGNAPPSTASDDPGRFTNAETQKIGRIAELYECFPSKYHRVLYANGGMDLQRKVFNKGISQGQSDNVTLIRKQASRIYAQCISSPIFQEARGKENPLSIHLEVQQALAIERSEVIAGTRTITYKSSIKMAETFPPILFARHDPKNGDGLFKSEEMIMVARTILTGNPVGGPLRSTSPYIRDDNRVNRTTPGFVAFVAVLTIYTISDDTALRAGVGNITRRTYAGYHDLYKRYIVQQSTFRKRLFKFWDDRLFPATSLEPVVPEPAVQSLGADSDLNPFADLVASFSHHSIAEDRDDNLDIYVGAASAPANEDPEDRSSGSDSELDEDPEPNPLTTLNQTSRSPDDELSSEGEHLEYLDDDEEVPVGIIRRPSHIVPTPTISPDDTATPDMFSAHITAARPSAPTLTLPATNRRAARSRESPTPSSLESAATVTPHVIANTRTRGGARTRASPTPSVLESVPTLTLPIAPSNSEGPAALGSAATLTLGRPPAALGSAATLTLPRAVSDSEFSARDPLTPSPDFPGPGAPSKGKGKATRRSDKTPASEPANSVVPAQTVNEPVPNQKQTRAKTRRANNNV